MFKIIALYALVGYVVCWPKFPRSTPEDQDLRLLEYLSELGEDLFKAPSNLTGEAVSQWSSSSDANPEELGIYAQGDIRFPATAKFRNGLKDLSTRWPNGVVPYVISDYFSPKDRGLIEEAIEEYHKLTCVRFVRRTSESDYVSITSGNTGCWSAVGKVGGKQELNLQSPGCLTRKGTAIHEMMHALGFLHEHTRWERDNYVSIAFQNIENGRQNNFEKAKKELTDDQGVEYDYGSVMHYSPNAFSKNGRPTIIPKKSSSSIGQRDGLSKMDIQKIRRMYKCKKVH